MAIPLIIAGVVAAFGVGKGIGALADNDTASSLNRCAQSTADGAKQDIEKARAASRRSLENLGSKKLYVCDVTLRDFVQLFEQIKDVCFEKTKEFDELGKFQVDEQTFLELRGLKDMTGSFVDGSVGGVVAGGAVALGAYGAAGVFATASTGAAISGLTGAAATNATLAFFGGGSIAAGGLGMAGGAMVLGGIVAAPALAVLGIVMGANASANLDKARSNLAEAKKMAEEFKVLAKACGAVRKRADLFLRILVKLDLIMYPFLGRLRTIISEEGKSYPNYSAESQSCIAAMLATVQSMKAILDTAILTEKGDLTEDSLKIANAVEARLGA